MQCAPGGRTLGLSLCEYATKFGVEVLLAPHTVASYNSENAVVVAFVGPPGGGPAARYEIAVCAGSEISTKVVSRPLITHN